MKGSKPKPVPDDLFRHVRFNMAVRVPLHAYLQFVREVDERLEELVARWASKAAPGATRRGPRSRL